MEMIILLRRAAFFLMKELFLCCARHRTICRKLIFGGAITTVAGAFLHMWFLAWHVTVSSDNSLNGSMQLSETLNEAGIDKFQIFPASSVISLNSSIEVIPSVRIKGKRAGVVNIDRRKIDNELKSIASPPPHRIPTSPLDRYIRTLSPIEALVFAKKEIEHAPIITEHPELYAPLFQNVSVFKRSYELMEMTFKIYIYRDGKRPVFHYPQLKGIYASEGWFMQLMEANKQFVTKDPERAHLFYLPYSVRRLEMALYKPNSHNLRPLSNFLRDYVNMIAAKYPFWNRTHGSDHFFVACHDWGPYTTTAHQELKENTIKVLCNADISEGIFKAGKDVSLPETTIRTPRRPHRYIGGGNRVSQRPILAFFAGYMHGRVRPILLKYWKKDEDMKIYRRLPVHVSQKMSYVQHMKSMKY
ncbi:Exostosin-like [Melia azedarach]|uniref:Exostosin-like n=1 Tax=Melia azedarach TaxID=155640 RepID=A0ACC1XN15_MELAZ|nr:Exostosin-like [Melia azedarach]